MIKNIIFDLDGTLIDTIDGISLALNETLYEFGHEPLSIEKVTSLLGDGVTSLVSRSLAPYSHTEEEIAYFLLTYLKRQKDYQFEGSKEYKGITKLLNTIKKSGIRTFVYSNKTHENAVLLVEKIFPGIFSGVSGQIKGNKPKPDVTALIKFMGDNHVLPFESIFVGDSYVDVATAKNANIVSVACTWGYNNIEVLKKSQPDFLISSPNEILKVLNSLK